MIDKQISASYFIDSNIWLYALIQFQDQKKHKIANKITRSKEIFSVGDRQQLIDTLQRSLSSKEQPTAKPKGLAANLIGIAKTDTLPPTDEEVKAMLDEQLK
jgi:predicted nucleic acid-binding protein